MGKLSDKFMIAIAITIRLWVLAFFIWTIRWINFSWIHTWPYIPPVDFNVGIFRAFAQFLLVYVAMTWVALAILYAVYFVINLVAKKIPFPMKIVRRIIFKKTPFKELIKSGLFDLFDSIIKASIRRDPNILIYGLYRFWKKNIVMITGDLGKVSAMLQSLDDEHDAKMRAYMDKKHPPQKRVANVRGYIEPPEGPEEPLGHNEQREIDQEYNICVQKATVPIYSTDTVRDKINKKLETNRGVIQCETERLRTAFALFSFV